jgi:23S rRNA (pseudouridine1915-N3)-methyltransferase
MPALIVHYFSNMLHIQIVQIGKTKAKYLMEGENEFLKRLKRYADIETITLNEEYGAMDKKKIIKKEGEAILSFLEKFSKDSYIIVLDINGKEYSSEQFAHLLEKFFVKGKIMFVIGGPYGLTEDVLNKADLRLSLSKMTFTHQMVRLFLLEQIYRAFTILEGRKYHY